MQLIKQKGKVKLKFIPAGGLFSLDSGDTSFKSILKVVDGKDFINCYLLGTGEVILKSEKYIQEVEVYPVIIFDDILEFKTSALESYKQGFMAAVSSLQEAGKAIFAEIEKSN